MSTPSGHIYSREVIVQYLLTKNRELKEQKAEYDRQRLQVENKRQVLLVMNKELRYTSFS